MDYATLKVIQISGVTVSFLGFVARGLGVLEAIEGQHPRWCFPFAGNRIEKSSTAWEKAKGRAGIEDFRFHDLRHYLPLLTMSRTASAA